MTPFFADTDAICLVLVCVFHRDLSLEESESVSICSLMLVFNLSKTTSNNFVISVAKSSGARKTVQ